MKHQRREAPVSSHWKCSIMRDSESPDGPAGRPTAERFMALFAGLDWAYGQYTVPPGAKADERGKVKGEALTVEAPLTVAQWEAHLNGGAGLGIIPIRDDGTVRFVAFDVDQYPIDQNAIAKKAKRFSLPVIVCRSKSGGAHGFAFFSEPVPAELARRKVASWVHLMGYKPGTEIFPKQDRLSEGDIGNWINAPYFGGKFSLRYAVDDDGALDIADFLDLAEAMRIDRAELESWPDPPAATERDNPEATRRSRGEGRGADFWELAIDEPGELIGVYDKINGYDDLLSSFAGLLYGEKYMSKDLARELVLGLNERWTDPLDQARALKCARSGWRTAERRRSNRDRETNFFCADDTPRKEMAAIYLKAVVAEMRFRAENPAMRAATVKLIGGNTMTTEQVDWLWKYWLARSKFELVAGVAGTGKTTIALSLAATITSGGTWPDGTRAPVGDVIIWSGEDNIADTLLPRLIACGACLERIHFVDKVIENGVARPFDPAVDFAGLARAAADVPGLVMTIIDPVVSAVASDSNKNVEVRRALQPLADFADATGSLVLGITHFTKNTSGKEPLERVTGSLAFGAVARLVMMTARGEEGCRLVRGKSNIGPDGGGYEYQLVRKELPEHGVAEAQWVCWGNSLEGCARDLLNVAEAEASPTKDQSKAGEAMMWLLTALKDGSVEQTRIVAMARENGIATGTLMRAKAGLGVKAEKDQEVGGAWRWRLPEKELPM
jgi:putative DNA primase/helicase